MTTTPPKPQVDSSKTSTAPASTEVSSQLCAGKPSDPPSDPALGDTKEEEKTGSSKTPSVQSSGSAEGSKKLASTESSTEKCSQADKSLAGASSGPRVVPPEDGAVGPDNKDVTAKMMEIMAKGSASATPKVPENPMADMMAMMSKGGGMPDMMSMMSPEGGMPNIMAMMSKGGMPDMMSMMSQGGSMADMKAMMNKMQGGPMGMAKLFDCIIDVSLARAESDSSDDDEDSITIEIPCQYCSRFFTSQMSLKTHILVAHEHEDTSVLNLTKLVIDKGKRGVKDHHGTRRKQSKDCEKSAAVEAASTDSLQSEGSTMGKMTSSQEDLSAAEPTRGVKRGRSERRESETSGASGVEEGSHQSNQGPLRLGSGAVPSSCTFSSPPESRKRSARLRGLRSNSGGASSQVTTKKSKSDDEKPDNDSAQQGSPSRLSAQPSSRVTVPGDEQLDTSDIKSGRTAKDSAKHKQIKTDLKQPSPLRQARVTRGQRMSPKDKAGSDTDISTDAPSNEATQRGRAKGRKARQATSVLAASVPAVSSSPQEREAVSASRRSLRSRKSH
ncbi:uncharacterized protein LOC143296626 [Babylonia areolata]|uniref:uncharacterized protein LOC143296626 n=1 Tax=Babylonia areolata TaxID=304850 RepID=UPI003FD10344